MGPLPAAAGSGSLMGKSTNPSLPVEGDVPRAAIMCLGGASSRQLAVIIKLEGPLPVAHLSALGC